MNRVSPEEFIQRLRRIGVLDEGAQARVEEMLAEESTLYVSEAVRDVLGLKEEEFLKLLCEEFGSEYVPPELLAQWPIQPEATELVASAQAHELALFPLDYDREKDRLLVFTGYPFNPHIVEELGDLVDVSEIEVTFGTEESLADLLRRGYIGSTDLFGDVDEEGSFEIGAATDEEAFPGIYGTSVSDFLYEMEQLEAEDAAASDAGGGGGVRGSIEDLSVVEMLQPLGQNRKTCSIFVESGESYASIYLQDGMVIHAETASASGPDAVYEVMQWEQGHFEILVRPYSGDPTMMENVEALLLEGMRRFDEANR